MAEGSAAPDVVELKIKTLDAQEIVVQVEKNASVQDLKQKVAEAGGCAADLQRLIYRGRVLKDSDHVSDYNIENGHVLHLVARPPAPIDAGESEDDMPELEDLAPGDMGQQEIAQHVVAGSISIDGAEGMPNLNQILSSVLNSLGLAGGFPMPAAFPPEAAPPAVVAGAAQQGDVEMRTIEMHFDIPQVVFNGQGLQSARAVPMAVPSRVSGQGQGQGFRGRADSLATIGSFLRHLERRMNAHIDLLRQHDTPAPAPVPRNLPAAPPAFNTTTGGVAGAGNTAAPASSPTTPTTRAATENAPGPNPQTSVATAPAPAPNGGGQAPSGSSQQANAASRPAALAGLLARTQALLQQQADPLLSIMHERLANEAAIVDSGDRGATQADLQIGGSLLQGLGALLLELGRTTRAINLNTEPGHAIVNPAPAAYISNSSVLLSTFLNQAPNVGVPLPQAQAPGALVFQVQSAPPVIPLQVPGTPAQVVLNLGPQQQAAPRAFPPGGVQVQIGDPQLGGGQMLGPNGGMMMQLLPNGTLAPIQGAAPAGSVFVGTVPANSTSANLQQAYAGAQAAQQQQQQNQQVQNMLTSLLGAYMPPQGVAQPVANGGVTAQPAAQSGGAPSGGGASRGPAQGAGAAPGNAQPGGGTGPSTQGRSRQTARRTQGTPSTQTPPPAVSYNVPMDGNAIMSMIGPVLQQLAGGGVNVVPPGAGFGGQQSMGPQGGGNSQPGQQQQGQGPAAGPQQSSFRFPSAPTPGQPQRTPPVQSVTVTRNVPIPGGVRTTTTTYSVSGQQVANPPPSGGNSQQPSSQGGQTAVPQGANGHGTAPPEQPAVTREHNIGSQTQPGGSQEQSAVRPENNQPAGATPVNGADKKDGGEGEGPAADNGKADKAGEQEAGVSSGAVQAPGGASGNQGAPAGLGGAGLQPLPPRSRRRPAPRSSEQHGRDGLAALSQALQGGRPVGPSAPPQGAPPGLDGLMGSVMQAVGGQGGGMGGLGGVLGQLMNNPGVDQMMRQVMGDEAGENEPEGADLGNMMSRMMPMVAQMFGGAGGPRAGGVRQRQGEGEEGWQEALSDEERVRWQEIIAQDEVAQAGAGPQRPLSDAYLRGSPAKRQKTGLDGAALKVQKVQTPGEVLESVAEAVRNKLVKEGEGGGGEGASDGSVPNVSQSEQLAEAYISTLVEDAVARAEGDPDFGDGSKFPKTKEATTAKKGGEK